MPTTDLVTIAVTLTLYAGLVISPGPGFALISRMALSGRRNEALAATAGFGVGATIYAALTMAGLAFVILKIDWLAQGLQILGGLYLIWLGIDAWRRPGTAEPVAAPARTIRRAFTTGLLVDLSNPKGIAFFLSLYAIAVTPETALWAKVTIVAGSFVLEIVWYSLVAFVLSQPAPRAVYRRFALWIDRTIGSVLAIVGAELIADRISTFWPSRGPSP